MENSIIELNEEEEKWLEEHIEKRSKLYRNQYQKEWYANQMTDYDVRYQKIVRIIRKVFVDEYKKRWEQKHS